MRLRLENANIPAYQHLISISGQFKTICQPLYNLGTLYFAYLKIFNNGSYLVLDQKLEEKDKNITLSVRETECLHYLSLGNSVKEIASILDLSPRTIESYLNNTKQKTDYYSRSKLVTNVVESKSSKFLNNII